MKINAISNGQLHNALNAVAGGIQRFYQGVVEDIAHLDGASPHKARPMRRRGQAGVSWSKLAARLQTTGAVARLAVGVLVDLLRPARPEHRLPRRWRSSRGREATRKAY